MLGRCHELNIHPPDLQLMNEMIICICLMPLMPLYSLYYPTYMSCGHQYAVTRHLIMHMISFSRCISDFCADL